MTDLGKRMRRLNSPIKAVSFDGDGTLWDFEKVMRGGLRKVFGEFRRIVDDPRALSVGVDDLIQLRDEIAASHPGPEQNHERIRRASFAALLGRFGVGDKRLADRLGETYFTHRYGVIELYDDTVATLDGLAGRYRVGLTSNGKNYPARFGLADYFDFVLFSEECGFAKPNPLFPVVRAAAGSRRAMAANSYHALGGPPKADVIRIFRWRGDKSLASLRIRTPIYRYAYQGRLVE